MRMSVWSLARRWGTTAAAMVTVVMALAACEWVGVTGCETYAAPALRIRIMDARTKTSAAAGTTVTVKDGDFTEVQVMPSDPQNNDEIMGFAFERAGVYTITVEKAGYRTATMSGVRVSEGECHVDTRVVTMSLVPN